MSYLGFLCFVIQTLSVYGFCRSLQCYIHTGFFQAVWALNRSSNMQLPPLPFTLYCFLGLPGQCFRCLYVLLEDQHLIFYNHVVNWRGTRINIERTRTFLFARGKNANELGGDLKNSSTGREIVLWIRGTTQMSSQGEQMVLPATLFALWTLWPIHRDLVVCKPRTHCRFLFPVTQTGIPSSCRVGTSSRASQKWWCGLLWSWAVESVPGAVHWCRGWGVQLALQGWRLIHALIRPDLRKAGHRSTLGVLRFLHCLWESCLESFNAVLSCQQTLQ